MTSMPFEDKYQVAELEKARSMVHRAAALLDQAVVILREDSCGIDRPECPAIDLEAAIGKCETAAAKMSTHLNVIYYSRHDD